MNTRRSWSPHADAPRSPPAGGSGAAPAVSPAASHDDLMDARFDAAGRLGRTFDDFAGRDLIYQVGCEGAYLAQGRFRLFRQPCATRAFPDRG